ncbi:MAG: nucleoside hydrolase [Ilumatobacteraceae bacterium]
MVLPVVIDCDPGHDDVFAIGVARKFLEIVGITTVCANSSIQTTTHNALVARDIFQLAHVPIVRGASHPLDGIESSISDAHGSTGLDGPTKRSTHGTVQPGDAADFLIEMSLRHESLWIIAIGPLTNIANACRRDPLFARRIAGLSIMGGSTTFGNVTPTSEYNIWFDPCAASEVFSSGANLRMCGLELTHQLSLGRDFAVALRDIGSDSAIFCSELFDYYLDYSVKLMTDKVDRVETIGAPLHDPCAVLALTHPEICSFEHLHVEVEACDSRTRGMTIADRRPWTVGDDANVDVVTSIDHKFARELIVRSFV